MKGGKRKRGCRRGGEERSGGVKCVCVFSFYSKAETLKLKVVQRSNKYTSASLLLAARKINKQTKQKSFTHTQKPLPLSPCPASPPDPSTPPPPQPPTILPEGSSVERLSLPLIHPTIFLEQPLLPFFSFTHCVLESLVSQTPSLALQFSSPSSSRCFRAQGGGKGGGGEVGVGVEGGKREGKAQSPQESVSSSFSVVIGFEGRKEGRGCVCGRGGGMFVPFVRVVMLWCACACVRGEGWGGEGGRKGWGMRGREGRWSSFHRWYLLKNHCHHCFKLRLPPPLPRNREMEEGV